MHRKYYQEAFLFLAILATFTLSGCMRIAQSLAGEEQGVMGSNALTVSFQRPPSDALADIKEFIQDRGATVRNISQWKVRSSTVSDREVMMGRMSKMQKNAMGNTGTTNMQIVASVESSSSGSSELTVGAYVYDRTTDGWSRATTGAMIEFTGMIGEKRSAEEIAFDALQMAMNSRYGSEAVNYTNAEL